MHTVPPQVLNYWKAAAQPPRSAPRRPLTQSWRWSGLHNQYDFNRGKPLGEGTYGMVCRAYPLAQQAEPVALKICQLDTPHDSGIPETVVREVTLLRELHGKPFVVSMPAFSCEGSKLAYLYCELMDLDLSKFIKEYRERQAMQPKRARPSGLGEDAARHVARGLLIGLAHCHAHQIVHRDLKPHNILVRKDLSAIKIADFGLARILHNPGKTLTHEVVTLWYRAPELLLGECQYNDAVDIWAVGCILAETLTGEVLFRGDSEIDMLFRIFRLLGTPPPDAWPELAFEDHTVFPLLRGDTSKLHIEGPARDLVLSMLALNPRDRPTCVACLRHPWFAEASPR